MNEQAPNVSGDAGKRRKKMGIMGTALTGIGVALGGLAAGNQHGQKVGFEHGRDQEKATHTTVEKNERSTSEGVFRYFSQVDTEALSQEARQLYKEVEEARKLVEPVSKDGLVHEAAGEILVDGVIFKPKPEDAKRYSELDRKMVVLDNTMQAIEQYQLVYPKNHK